MTVMMCESNSVGTRTGEKMKSFALLFNADQIESKLYGSIIQRKIFETNHIQRSKKRISVRVGDFLFNDYAKNRNEYIELALKLFLMGPAPYLQKDKFFQVCLAAANIYMWVLINVELQTVTDLNLALSAEVSFLGSVCVNYDDELHKLFMHDHLINQYVVEGTCCEIVEYVSQPTDRSIVDENELISLGFTSIGYLTEIDEQ